MEVKTFSPKQLQVMGKSLGQVNKKPIVTWLATVVSLPANSSENLIAFLRECITKNDLRALPGDVKCRVQKVWMTCIGMC